MGAAWSVLGVRWGRLRASRGLMGESWERLGSFLEALGWDGGRGVMGAS